jgi:putative DNA primase/helicase
MSEVEKEASNPTTIGETDNQALARLSSMPPLEYDKIREKEAEKLGVRVSVLDAEVQFSRKLQQAGSGTSGMFPEVMPWPEAVNANELLHDMVSAIRRFIVCDEETAIAAALWCIFTWLIDHVQISPLAIITAPEKRCGKTQLLTLMGRLVHRPLSASNISPAATFRVIEAYHPTLLIDEADTFFRDNEELRGIINSGHTRQASYVIRSVGTNHEPKQFSTWAAKALSGIGNLPETIMDRSIVLVLRRKLAGEQAQRIRHTDFNLFDELASKIARLTCDFGKTIALSRPSLPEVLNDRAQDNWEPLLAIADHAGGHWPQAARSAALKLSGEVRYSVSLSTKLLADIRELFDAGAVRISSADLVTGLCRDPEKPWATYNKGKPLSQHQLSKLLGGYKIQSKTIRIGHSTPKGFEKSQFEDVFARYLAPAPSINATTPQPSATAIDIVAGAEGGCQLKQEPETLSSALSNDCGAVADFTPSAGANRVEIPL